MGFASRFVLAALVPIAAALAASGRVSAQSATLEAPGENEHAWFGHSVALQSGRLAVGAPFSLGLGARSTGRAWVFERTGNSWATAGALLASDGEHLDRFGIGIALDGDTVIVGAESEGPGDIYYGAAYVFVRSAGQWIQQAKLTAPVRVADSRFGLKVALSGDTAAVAAMQDSSISSLAGSVHVFTRSGSTWSHQQKLTVNDVNFQAAFGFDLALDGDTLVASTPYDDPGSIADAGSLHVFARSGSTWTKLAKLLPLAPNPSLRYGASLALQGGTMIVGSFDLPGQAFVLEGGGANWTQTAELQPIDPSATAFFGVCVALDGNRAAVGAYGEHVTQPFAVSAGAVYLFDRVGGSWKLVERLVSPTPSYDDAFCSVSIDGSEFVIGETRDGPLSEGAVHLYELGGPQSYCTAGTTTNGCTAHLSLDRLPSVTSSAPSFLVASGTEGQTTGLVFLGAATNSTPWTPTSTSTLCVAQPLARMPPALSSGGTGGACDGRIAPNVNSYLQSHLTSPLGQAALAGATIHAQAWFRDPPAPNGGNLSDALSFVFYP